MALFGSRWGAVEEADDDGDDKRRHSTHLHEPPGTSGRLNIEFPARTGVKCRPIVNRPCEEQLKHRRKGGGLPLKCPSSDSACSSDSRDVDECVFSLFSLFSLLFLSFLFFIYLFIFTFHSIDSTCFDAYFWCFYCFFVAPKDGALYTNEQRLGKSICQIRTTPCPPARHLLRTDRPLDRSPFLDVLVRVHDAVLAWSAW